MAENCKNCKDAITGNFCANCGQKKYKKIDKKYHTRPRRLNTENSLLI
jgi:hypothetical protein